jgi:hypothetical protein
MIDLLDLSDMGSVVFENTQLTNLEKGMLS